VVLVATNSKRAVYKNGNRSSQDAKFQLENLLSKPKFFIVIFIISGHIRFSNPFQHNTDDPHILFDVQ
jgi:hypothetical protein